MDKEAFRKAINDDYARLVAQDDQLKAWAITCRTLDELRAGGAPDWLIGWWHRWRNGEEET